MFSKRIRSFIVIMLLAALLLPMLPTTAHAAYENTYKNTGNMRDDIIGVALTQVGYREGSNNYTKYGVWYGLSNSPWCGMFVSWCAAQAGIPTSVLKRTGIANPSNFGLSYKSGSEYTPQKGDLFFKKSFSHVGLVYYTEGDYFYTIEGNTSDVSSEGTSVLIRRRKISDFYFSSPNYSGSSSSSSGCNHSYSTGYEAGHPHKEYKACTKCGKTSYTGNNVSLDSCTTCIQAACSHDFGSWSNANSEKHKRTCSKCNYEQTNSHEWELDKVTKEATCVDEGTKLLICSVCDAEISQSIPVTNEHTYGKAAYINESIHQKVCSVCGKQETFEHTHSSNWINDTLYHWTSCIDCGGRIRHTEHTFSGGCLLPCDTCDYVQSAGHKFDEGYQYNIEGHWQICVKCGLESEHIAHNYSTDCAENCDECGYQRTTTADHSYEYIADETGHQRECTSCQHTTPHTQHTANQNVEEWQDITCIHCTYVLRSSDRHVHTIQNVQYDNATHWGTCVCGEDVAPEVHVWNISTGKCGVCNVTYTANTHDQNFLAKIIRTLFRN